MTQAYPLHWPDGWPRQKYRSLTSRFQTTFIKARADLLHELDLMGATNAVISSWLPLRNDGLPRADGARMRLEDPGVAVYFQWRKKSMVMARDEYGTVHDNLRSIGLAVAHLRGLERHGGGTMMERAFEGFAQLASPDAFDAWAILGLKRDASTSEIEAKFRELAKRHHPDVGGDPAQFVAIKRAREIALGGQP